MKIKLLKAILVAAALINLIAVLGPELGFDALWYHLTIPKIYLMWKKIDFIPGGLMYYSAMPRLGELLFLVGDRGAHFISWLAGLGAAFLTYKLARKYTDRQYSLLAAIIFYCTPLVGWLSGSAYVDLVRTFFEVLALYLVVSKKYVAAGIAVGLAISTKTLALGSLAILLIISGFSLRILLPAVLISAPWFIWALLKTGYPFYPIGAGILNTNEHSNVINLFAEDKLSPLYLFIIPFLNKKYILLIIYCVLAFVFWLLTPQNGGGRFLLPYLPAFAVLLAVSLPKKNILIFFVILFAFFSMSYRFAANLKVFPYIFGRETKEQYLCSHLDFSTGVFVDCDGWFSKNIKSNDLVLVKGFHNLYYINFSFVHESWYKNEKVSYILSNSPMKGNLIYKNNLTHAFVYKQ